MSNNKPARLKAERRAFSIGYTMTLTAKGNGASMTETTRAGRFTVTATNHAHAIRVARSKLRHQAQQEAADGGMES